MRERAASAGKSVEVTLNLGRLDYLDESVALGIDRIVYALPSSVSSSELRRFIGDVGRIAQQAGEASAAPVEPA